MLWCVCFVPAPLRTFAVVVFFMMSGHLVALRYLQSRDPRHLARSVACRVPRMAIPVLAALLWNWVLAAPALGSTYGAPGGTGGGSGASGASRSRGASEHSGSCWLRVFDAGGVSARSTFATWANMCFLFGHGRLEYEHFPGAGWIGGRQICYWHA